MENKSTAPALTRGLEIMELISQHSQITFGQLKEETGYHATTLNRLLKVLIDKNYVEKLGTGYSIGPQPYLISRRETHYKSLVDRYRPILRRLNSYYGITFMLVGFRDEQFVVLDKCIATDNLAMLEIGSIRGELANFPWGIIYMEQMTDTEIANQIEKIHTHQASNMNYVSDEQIYYQLNQVKEKGYVDDKAFYFRGRRLAVPLYDKKNQLIGALCCGAFFEGLDLSIEELANDLARYSIVPT